MQIYTATHPMNAELRRTEEFGKPVEIGSDVWVGGGAIICPGVTIGSRAVIGAGSVVTRDIPEGVFAGGQPVPVGEGIGLMAAIRVKFVSPTNARVLDYRLGWSTLLRAAAASTVIRDSAAP